MDWRIQPMTAEDIPALAQIEQQCFAAPWSASALADELHNPAAHFITAKTENGKLAGYVGLLVVGDEGFFTNVAVSPLFRRQGAADALLDALDAYGREQGLYRLTLEVRVSNLAARALYAKHGFKRDGIRPNFYRHPTEDAVICSLYFEEV